MDLNTPSASIVSLISIPEEEEEPSIYETPPNQRSPSPAVAEGTPPGSTPPPPPPPSAVLASRGRLSRQGRTSSSTPNLLVKQLNSQTSIPDWFFERPPTPVDLSEMSVQTEPPPSQNVSSQTAPMEEHKPPVRQLATECYDAGAQTEPMGKKDSIVQTIDSYLRIAKRLEILRTNRTDSLHVMAAGPMQAKKKARQQMMRQPRVPSNNESAERRDHV